MNQFRLNREDHMKTGDKAPQFGAAGRKRRKLESSGSFRQNGCSAFYPGDNTPVCTAQLCSIRDNWADYVETGAEVVGILLIRLILIGVFLRNTISRSVC